MTLDYFTVVISFFAGYYTYHFIYSRWSIGAGFQPFKIYRNLAFISGFLFLIIFERFGLYSRKVGLLNVEEMKKILQSLLIGSLFLFSFSFLFRPILFSQPYHSAPLPDFQMLNTDFEEQGILLYSRLILMYSLILLFININIQRHIMNRLLLWMHIKGPGLNRVLIYGTGDIGRQLQRRLFENPRIGLKPIGFIDDDFDKIGTEINGIVGKKETALKVLGNELQLQELVTSWNIQEIIIAQPNATTARICEIINSCIKAQVRFSFVPNLFNLFIQQVQFEEIEGIPILRLKSQRSSYIYLAIKRLFDICVSFMSIILFMPILPIIIIAIKSDSKGPVLFIQERVGKDGKLFKIYKFRSMYIEADHYDRSPENNDDPRITRIGKLLRRFSIDEFPQFFNVLRGDMSIVGPRPEMPYVVENYTPLQFNRLKVRPGITGIWQVSSARLAEIHENLDYDFYYTENQSFMLDLVIIGKTIAASVKGRGV